MKANTNTNAYTPLAIGNYSNAVAVDFWVDKVRNSANVMFEVDGKKVPFYGSLSLTETKTGKTPRYYTLKSLSRIGWTLAKSATFKKDVIGQIADLDVVHYEDAQGDTRAKVSRFFKPDETTLADLIGDDDCGISEEEGLYK